LFNFTQFIEWPDRANPPKGPPLAIGIVGEDPFGAVLDETVKGETSQGRSLAVRRFAAGAAPEGCIILFFSRSEKERIPGWLRAMKGKPVLTVSEVEDFCRLGGMIRFIVVAGKVRFEINPEAAQQGGLRISARLLQLARIVKSG
jgi:hypothetical protein